MEFHSPEQKKERFTKGRLVDIQHNLEKARLFKGRVQPQIELGMQFYILCMANH